jgi:hypothetical protein
MTETLYKCLKEGREATYIDGFIYPAPNGKRPGKWLPPIADIEACRRGYHVCRVSDILEWCAAELWVVEVRGDRVDSDDKVVVGQVRLLRRVDDWQKILRLLAADCADRALSLYGGDKVDPRSWAAVDAARDHAHGRITDEQLAAARAAARAVWDTAWAAEKSWQTSRLAEYMTLGVDGVTPMPERAAVIGG